MFNGLRIGVTGMQTSQKVMDNVADQIANSTTGGYKKKEVRFGDLLRNEISRSHAAVSENAEGASIGIGSRALVSKTNFTQGVLKPSESPFHMAIEGNGFFGVMTAAGDLLLTRNGAFSMSADGALTDGEENGLVYESYVPAGSIGSYDGVSISENGVISGRNDRGEVIELGRVALFQPGAEDGLLSLGENKYFLLEGMGMANSIDDAQGFGVIRHKHLEESNVDIAESMTEMILTQRAYQLNAKSITTADEMLEVINTII